MKVGIYEKTENGFVRKLKSPLGYEVPNTITGTRFPVDIKAIPARLRNYVKKFEAYHIVLDGVKIDANGNIRHNISDYDDYRLTFDNRVYDTSVTWFAGKRLGVSIVRNSLGEIIADCANIRVA